MQKTLKINFVGNYLRGYVGEIADEVHLARSLEELGHTVYKVPRDIWKAMCDGDWNDDWKQYVPQKADINIICKWHHFNDKKYVNNLRQTSGAPVFYWVWDYMFDETSIDFIGWHKEIAEASDLLLTNEGGLIPAYQASLINAYYFPFDVADQSLGHYQMKEKLYDVVFFGSCLDQGDRKRWLTEINAEIPLTIFSWNYQEWEKLGIKAFPAVYGEEFNKAVAQSKICLQMSVNDHTWGYWSNRVGKTLLAGGFLLARYAPGMELFLKDGAAYFNSPQEAIEKIKFYLANEASREYIRGIGEYLGRNHFSSIQRCRELVLLIENYKKGGISKKI